jgi:hypothetical protein
MLVVMSGNSTHRDWEELVTAVMRDPSFDVSPRPTPTEPLEPTVVVARVGDRTYRVPPLCEALVFLEVERGSVREGVHVQATVSVDETGAATIARFACDPFGAVPLSTNERAKPGTYGERRRAAEAKRRKRGEEAEKGTTLVSPATTVRRQPVGESWDSFVDHFPRLRVLEAVIEANATAGSVSLVDPESTGDRLKGQLEDQREARRAERLEVREARKREVKHRRNADRRGRYDRKRAYWPKDHEKMARLVVLRGEAKQRGLRMDCHIATLMGWSDDYARSQGAQAENWAKSGEAERWRQDRSVDLDIVERAFLEAGEWGGDEALAYIVAALAAVGRAHSEEQVTKLLGELHEAGRIVLRAVDAVSPSPTVADGASGTATPTEADTRRARLRAEVAAFDRLLLLR